MTGDPFGAFALIPQGPERFAALASLDPEERFASFLHDIFFRIEICESAFKLLPRRFRTDNGRTLLLAWLKNKLQAGLLPRRAKDALACARADLGKDISTRAFTDAWRDPKTWGGEEHVLGRGQPRKTGSSSRPRK